MDAAQQACLPHATRSDVNADAADEASLERDAGEEAGDVGQLGLPTGDLASGLTGGVGG